MYSLRMTALALPSLVIIVRNMNRSEIVKADHVYVEQKIESAVHSGEVVLLRKMTKVNADFQSPRHVYQSNQIV